ncbi:feruloyl esterase B [Pseudovirgaria hyperparasitica]|uniref:Carboxylic ester hydrolase n=1 Tax=Pseudovirgaria hyperparasitica TaxID=470096 RepID=A0A6A6W5C6_9PEZI|nr:feruloyl esterase B [Pseudovirgaria hyperparasitica]KAF2757803.1 feruloyl esterase B [Pseudovirgaria hyperparasitica]
MILTLSLLWTVIICKVYTLSLFEARCLRFDPGRYYSNSTVTALAFIPAKTTLQFPDNDQSCKRPSQLIPQDICRIAMSLPTSHRSSIIFEAWFPSNWSGRFLATGNGGIDGCIRYEDMAYATSNGFAAVGSNNGHNGTTGVSFDENDDIVTDFAWRSLHTITGFGKKILHVFYEKHHSKSYYLGCSLGGRQGIKATMKFPSDYDGVVAGSPAVDFNHMISWRGSFYPMTGGSGDARYVDQALWKGLVHEEVLRQCDTLDGAKDGIIEDPTRCNFDPGALLCGSDAVHAGSTTCLGTAQVEAVRRIFKPMTGAHGEILYPAMQPGSEDKASEGLYNGAPWPYSLDWYRYVVYDPSWNGSRMTPRDIQAAESRNPSNIRTFPRQLHEFKARGGKILTFHGQQDNQISSFNSNRLWDRLNIGMSGDLDSFYRFFRISGMNHCNTGPGAWVFGQGGGVSAAGVPFESSQNILAALVDWVEYGRAPEHIVGTKFVNDTVLAGQHFQRRHCKYPATNTFVGTDPYDVDSWECH